MGSRRTPFLRLQTERTFNGLNYKAKVNTVRGYRGQVQLTMNLNGDGICKDFKVYRFTTQLAYEASRHRVVWYSVGVKSYGAADHALFEWKHN